MATRDSAFERRAIALAKEAYRLAKLDMEHNPGDRNLVDQAAVTTTVLSVALHDNHRSAEALPFIREAGAAIQGLVQVDPRNNRYSYLQVNNREVLAQVLIELHRFAEAEAVLTEGERQVNTLLKEAPDNFYAAENKVSLLSHEVELAEMVGQLDRARERCRAGLEVAAALMQKDRSLETHIGSLGDLRRRAVSSA